MQNLIFSNHVGQELDKVLRAMAPKGVFVLVDANTYNCAWPILHLDSEMAANATLITVQAGDESKNADSLQAVWKQLSDGGATRQSVLVNLGGGMITDLGGFAAATFKRGIRFVNVPTSLLGAVDAAVGGKTGINFSGLKNEVGAFAPAEAVIISTLFFNTLPRQEMLSGYAEMLKHGLLSSAADTAALLGFGIADAPFDSEQLLALLQQSVQVKAAVVESDPTEAGPRKALNLGHTVGHAFESFAMGQRQSPIPHGYAVAWGLVVELILSHMLKGFPSALLHQVAAYVKENYGYFSIDCKDYPALLALMAHDKKNSSPSAINFTLLSAPGAPVIDCVADAEQIKSALDIYRDIME